MTGKIISFVCLVLLGGSTGQISTSSNTHSQPPLISLSSDLFACCSHIDSPSQLVHCVNQTTVQRLEGLDELIPYKTNKHGPKLLVSLVTRATPQIFDYASYTYFLQAVYAEQNGYSLLPLFPDSKTEDYQLYRKLVPLQEALNGLSLSADCDFIVWMDADIAILDLGMRIEKIAAEYPRAHLIVSADVSSVINSGFIIFRNTPWAMNFIKKWWEARKLSQGTVTDQMGFESLFDRMTSDEKNKIAILSPDALNSDAPPMSRQLPHNQVLHLAAESIVLRQNVFKVGMKEVCDAVSQHRQPSHQLGLHRQFIRNMTEYSYGAQARRLIEKYKDWRYADHIEADRKNLLDEITTLRYDTSKHLYAISYRMEEIESPESIEMRRQVSGIISNITKNMLTSIVGESLTFTFQSFTQSQLIQMSRHQDKVLVLNLLKISSECSYELLQAIQPLVNQIDSIAFQQWKMLSDEIMLNLNIMLQLVNPQQQHIVLDMKASLYGNLGDLYSSINHIEEGIKYFRESLSLYGQLRVMNEKMGIGGGGGDKRAMLSIQSSLARSLCVGPNSDEGMSLFRSTIAEESSHVGPNHHNLIPKYYNAGVCASTKGLIVEAIELFQQAIKSCEVNPHVPLDDTCNRARDLLLDLQRRRRFAPTGVEL